MVQGSWFVHFPPTRHLRHRVILSEGMSFPVFGHQDPTEIGMSRESDAEHVEDLALMPIGGGPHAGHRGHLRSVQHPNLYPNAVRAGDRVQVIDPLESRPRTFQPIHATAIAEKVIPQTLVLFEEAADAN